MMIMIMVMIEQQKILISGMCGKRNAVSGCTSRPVLNLRSEAAVILLNLCATWRGIRNGNRKGYTDESICIMINTLQFCVSLHFISVIWLFWYALRHTSLLFVAKFRVKPAVGYNEIFATSKRGYVRSATWIDLCTLNSLYELVVRLVAKSVDLVRSAYNMAHEGPSIFNASHYFGKSSHKYSWVAVKFGRQVDEYLLHL